MKAKKIVRVSLFRAKGLPKPARAMDSNRFPLFLMNAIMYALFNDAPQKEFRTTDPRKFHRNKSSSPPPKKTRSAPTEPTGDVRESSENPRTAQENPDNHNGTYTSQPHKVD